LRIYSAAGPAMRGETEIRSGVVDDLVDGRESCVRPRAAAGRQQAVRDNGRSGFRNGAGGYTPIPLVTSHSRRFCRGEVATISRPIELPPVPAPTAPWSLRIGHTAGNPGPPIQICFLTKVSAIPINREAAP